MRQSVSILDQALKSIPGGPVNIDDPKIFLPEKAKVLRSMEELIHQFMIVTEGFSCPAGEIYVATEVPKGELGFYLVSQGASPLTGAAYAPRRSTISRASSIRSKESSWPTSWRASAASTPSWAKRIGR
jgi:NADH:ubiquinone oxidoreductase subunit D